jgi:hypothetical protein
MELVAAAAQLTLLAMAVAFCWPSHSARGSEKAVVYDEIEHRPTSVHCSGRLLRVLMGVS